ncbi:hypothetical protein [Streptomyces niveus]|uniref:hypothetical protein n=1 Tax=Streptomyces niveus TaxID=193462 RepID=UPI00369C8C6F
MREHQRKSKPVTGRSEKQKRWYGGEFVHSGSGSQPGRPVLPPGECPTDGCGQECAGRTVQRLGWIRVHVQGSEVPPRTFCSGSCVTVGIALAELRMRSTAWTDWPTPDVAAHPGWGRPHIHVRPGAAPATSLAAPAATRASTPTSPAR